MRETVHGAKYEATRNLRTADIARLFRGEIKAAIKNGTLPAGLKVSVTTDVFSGGSSIDTVVTAVPAGFELFTSEYIEHEALTPNDYWRGGRDRCYTDAALAVTSWLESTLGAYNFDGSDSQSDYFHVRFYGHTKFGWQLESALKAEQTASFLEARVATLVVAPAPTPDDVELFCCAC